MLPANSRPPDLHLAEPPAFSINCTSDRSLQFLPQKVHASPLDHKRTPDARLIPSSIDRSLILVSRANWPCSTAGCSPRNREKTVVPLGRSSLSFHQSSWNLSTFFSFPPDNCKTKAGRRYSGFSSLRIFFPLDHPSRRPCCPFPLLSQGDRLLLARR